MTFGAPHFLWLLAVIPALVALFFYNEHRGRALVGRFVAVRLLPVLAGNVSVAMRRLRFALEMLALAAVIVSLARPQFGHTWEESKRKGRDVILAIDTSKSMLAADLPPSRLVRAKLAAQDLLRMLGGDRVGVIAFAGSAFLQAPLTADFGAVLSAVDALDTEIIPRGGTNIAEAIRVAAEAFGKGESEHRALIVFTDGEELEADGVEVAKSQREAMRIFTVGLGSPDGAVIPVPGEGGGTDFVRDSAKNIVHSKLDEERLRGVAQAAGGFYVRLQDGPAAMKQIVAQGLGKMSEHEMDARVSRKPIERYQWPLSAGLLLFAVAFVLSDRRRERRAVRAGVPARVAAMLALYLMLAPGGAFALNKGVELYGKKEYAAAEKVFKEQLEWNARHPALHYGVGTTAYKQEDFETALNAFTQALTTRDPALRERAEYNLGNTLFQRGARQKEKEGKLKEWRAALDHYEEALKIDPADADTKYNRDLVRKLIEDLLKEEKKDQDQQQKDKDKKEENQDKQQKDSGKNKDQKDQQKNQEQQKQQKSDQQEQQPQKSQDQQQKEQQQQQQKDQQQKADQKDQQQQKQQQADQKQDQQGEQKEQKDQSKQAKQGDQGEKQKADAQPQPQGDQKPGEQKKPQPGEAPQLPERKHSGELKSQAPQPSEKGPEQEADVPLEEKPGEMNEAQARALLEALRGEDDRVPLLERKSASPVWRDW